MQPTASNWHGAFHHVACCTLECPKFSQQNIAASIDKETFTKMVSVTDPPILPSTACSDRSFSPRSVFVFPLRDNPNLSLSAQDPATKWLGHDPNNVGSPGQPSDWKAPTSHLHQPMIQTFLQWAQCHRFRRQCCTSEVSQSLQSMGFSGLDPTPSVTSITCIILFALCYRQDHIP